MFDLKVGSLVDKISIETNLRETSPIVLSLERSTIIKTLLAKIKY